MVSKDSWRVTCLEHKGSPNGERGSIPLFTANGSCVSKLVPYEQSIKKPFYRGME